MGQRALSHVFDVCISDPEVLQCRCCECTYLVGEICSWQRLQDAAWQEVIALGPQAMLSLRASKQTTSSHNVHWILQRRLASLGDQNQQHQIFTCFMRKGFSAAEATPGHQLPTFQNSHKNIRTSMPAPRLAFILLRPPVRWGNGQISHNSKALQNCYRHADLQNIKLKIYYFDACWLPWVLRGNYGGDRPESFRHLRE